MTDATSRGYRKNFRNLIGHNVYGVLDRHRLSFVIASQLWHQDVAGVEDLAEHVDHFGRVVMSGDFNGDGRDDLAVGVPAEDLYGVNGSVEGAGAMNVIYGSSIGLNTSKGSIPDQFWTQTVILPPQP